MIKTIRTFPVRLLFIGLVGISSLVFSGFARTEGQDPVSRLQQAPVSLEVPIIKQALSTSCGEAAIAMAYNYAYPHTPITEQEAIDYATQQGFFTPGTPPFTSPANMVKIAEFYADDVSSGAITNSDQGLRFLAENLQEGTPVIIDVLTNFQDPQSEAHFIVVTGISVAPDQADEIIVRYNDPLTGTAESAVWSGAQGVWNAWQNNGDPGGQGWWLTITPP